MANFSDMFRNMQEIAAKAEEVAKEAGKHIGTAVNQTYEALAPQVNDVVNNVENFTHQAYVHFEQKAGEAAEYLKEQTQRLNTDPAQVLSLDEIGRKIASLGFPAIVFAVAASIAGGMGLAGGAVITTALAMLGGPAGMIGGLLTLGVLTLIADAVGKYGIESVLLSTYTARREQGISTEELHREIDSLWLSDELKWKLKTSLSSTE